MRVLDHDTMPPASDAIRAWVAALCDATPSRALESAVASAWRTAHEAHPEIAVTPVELFRFVGERLGDAEPASELGRRHIADLFLACGCDRGDPAALLAIEQQTLPSVERRLTGMKLAAELRRDVMQVLRERMLVERDGRRGIAAYDGTAPLAVWLRVCAARLGMRQADRAKREIEIDDGRLEQLAPGVPDPELTYLRRHYGAEFKTAFAAAVAELAPRERNLLRHAVIDGLGIDQIAAIYHVHRATAARQLKQARASLIDGTRERMRLALRVSERELESIMRVIMSRADITLREVLAKGRGHAQETE